MLAKVVGRWSGFVYYIKQGWDQQPYLFGSGFVGLVGLGMLIHRILVTPEGGYIARYKERYMVLRPTDERLYNYPKNYVTDKDLLK